MSRMHQYVTGRDAIIYANRLFGHLNRPFQVLFIVRSVYDAGTIPV
jgi:hypothetical protein